MIAEGIVGQRNLADGVMGPQRLTQTGDLAIAQAHGRHWDAVMRGNCYAAAMQAAAALGTALTATAVTLTLYNPAGSNRYLVLLETTLAIPVATTAGQVVYAVNSNTAAVVPATVTELASGVRNALIGGPAGNVAKVYSAATLPAAPVAHRVLAGVISTTPGGIHTIVDDVDGKIILAPNTAVTVQGITGNGTGQIGYLWEEIAF